MMEDITPQGYLADTPQPDAIKNIQSANTLGIPPMTFADNKETLQPEADKLVRPPLASPILAGIMREDQQKASAYLPDTEHLSTMENIWHDSIHKIKNSTTTLQDLDALTEKQMANGGKLSEDDDAIATSLENQMIADPQHPVGEMGTLAKFTGSALGTAADLVHTAWRHKEIVAGLAATEAALYGIPTAMAAGALTAPIGGVGAPVAGGISATGGAVIGAWHGYFAASVLDAYQRTKNQTYRDLGKLTIPETTSSGNYSPIGVGNPMQIDESNKVFIAQGVGVLNAAVTAGATKLLSKSLPFLKNILSKAPELVSDPANIALKESIIKLGQAVSKSGGIMGGAAVVQQIVSNLGTSLAKTENSAGHVDLANGILNGLGDLDPKELADTFGVGALTGALLHGTGMGLEKVFGTPPSAYRPGDNAKVVGPFRPQAPEGAPGNEAPRPKSPPPSPHSQAIEILNFQDTLDATSKILQDTKVHQIDPATAQNVRKVIFDKLGMPSIYIDKDKLGEFSNTPEKAKAIQDKIDPSGFLSAQLNAPIAFKPEDIAAIHDAHPEIGDHVKLDPNGPTPNDARKLYENIKAQEAARAEIQTKLKVGDQTPEDRAKYVNLTGEADDTTLAKSLGTKEVADAYLKELDKQHTRVSNLLQETDRRMVDYHKERLVDHEKELQDYLSQKNPPLDITNVKDSWAKEKLDSKLKKIDEKYKTLEDDTALNKKILERTEKQLSDYKNSEEGKTLKLGKDQKLIDLENQVEHRKSYLETPSSIAAKKLEDIAIAKEKFIKDQRFIAEKSLNQKKKDLENNVKFKKDTIADYQKKVENPVPIQKYVDLIGRVQKIKETLPTDAEEKSTLTAALENTQPDNNIFYQKDYLNQRLFPNEVEKYLPPSLVHDINRDQRLARENRADYINQLHENDMEKVIDAKTAEQSLIDAQRDQQRLENNPNIKTVEKFYNPNPIANVDFKPSNRYWEKSQFTEAHQKPGFSPFAVDPRLLTPAQKEAFISDKASRKQLRAHNFFVKGGISPDNAAYALGFRNGNDLMKMMAETPTRDQILENRRIQNEAVLRDKIRSKVDLDHLEVSRSFHNSTANHIAEMKFMRENKWPSTKKGIKSIAMGLPRIEELTQKAQNATEKTLIKNLNGKKFEVAQNRNHKTAIDAITDNDVPKAYISEYHAALASELAIANHIAIGEVNKIQKFLASNLHNAETLRELKAAGNLDAWNEITSVYNLTKSKKGAVKQGAYLEWVKEQAIAGVGNFGISEKLTKDIRTQTGDMTVAEFKAVGKALRTLLHRAKRYNRLNNEFGDPAKQRQLLQDAIDNIHEHLKGVTGYDVNRKIGGKDKPIPTSIIDSTSDALSTFRNLEHLTVAADDMTAGPLAQHIVANLYGDGKFGNQGVAGKAHDIKIFTESVRGLIEKLNGESGDTSGKLGTSKIAKMVNKIIYVPEFADNPLIGFRDGRIRQSDLLMMYMNDGTASNSERMIKGLTHTNSDKQVLASTDIQTLRKVFDRELEPEHVEFAQGVMDIFESYRPRVMDFHERITGEKPELIPAQKQTHRGVERRGGYFPLITQEGLSVRKITRNSVQDERDPQQMIRNFAVDDMTQHSHLMERTGSNEPLNFSLNNIGIAADNFLHDLNFREPIADSLKTLLHPMIAEDVIALLGSQNLNVMVNSIVDLSGSGHRDQNLLEYSRWTENLASKFSSAVSSGFLVGNLTSHGVQFASMIHANRALGNHIINKHLTNAIHAFLTNPGSWGDYIQSAAKINPDIAAHLADVNDNMRDPISKLLPRKTWSTTTGLVTGAMHILNEKGFHTLSVPDLVQKAIVAHAGYTQFLHGEAPGFPLEKLAKMDADEIDHMAKVFSNSISRQNLTSTNKISKSPFQRNHKLLALFSTDPRNSLNQGLLMGRNIVRNYKRGNYWKAALGTASAFATMTMLRMFYDLARGYETPWSSQGVSGYSPQFHRFDPKQITKKGFATKVGWYVLSSPSAVLAGDFPFLKDIDYSETAQVQGSQRKKVSNIFSTLQEDAALTFDIANNLIDALLYDKKLSAPSKAALKGAGITISGITGTPIPVHLFENIYNAEQYFQKGKAIPQLEAFLSKLKDLEAHAGDLPDGLLERLKELGDQFKPKETEAAQSYGIKLEALTQKESKALETAKLSPSPENVYAVNLLGVDKAVKILTAPGAEKLSNFVSKDFLETNGFSDKFEVESFKLWLGTEVQGSKTGASLDNQNSKVKD
jgi:hypothetical protein